MTASVTGTGATADAATDTGTRRVRLDVSGMTCGACAARIEKKLNKVAGVRASVNFATGVATIDADGALAETDLCQVIEKTGYGAEPHREIATTAADPHDRQARDLLLRLAVAAVLFVPLADLSMMFAVVPSTRFTGWQWVLLVLALPVVTWAAWPFHRVALRNARRGTASMETLISVGVSAATLWSLYTIFFAADPHREATGIWQALLTTVAGLVVAIPALLSHEWLESRIDEMVLQMQEAVVEVETWASGRGEAQRSTFGDGRQ